jgi:alkanesulfonate monooxygenase SsuD/methylene tetrahydromethanopterin reductase-like flavin-dependent oxidoreductase (luciferase family)
MRIGTDISVLSEPGRPDSSVLAEHLALADLAEPLGFDSLFALEHHFTGYSMSPSPLQTLAYFVEHREPAFRPTRAAARIGAREAVRA